MKRGYNDLPESVRTELEGLADKPDSEINTDDIPEILDWSNAERGVFYRPMKRQVTLRLDSDIIAWFKLKGPGGRGYQTRINEALRAHIHNAIEKQRAGEEARPHGTEPTP